MRCNTLLDNGCIPVFRSLSRLQPANGTVREQASYPG